MPAYDAGFKIVARAAGRQLAALAGVDCDQWAPIVSEVQATERLADRAFLARRGRERFVVYMEAYTHWLAAAPWSLLAKSGLLSERERLPTVSLVYILLPRGYRSQAGNFHLAAVGQSTQQVWFREICLWQEQPQPWWEEVPGLMALSPLCRQARPAREVLTRAAEAIGARTPDPVQRADLLTTLGIFGKLKHPMIDAFQLIGRQQMQQSKFYQEIQEEGRVMGRLEMAREAVIQVLEAKFGPEMAAEFRPQLSLIMDRDHLSRLLRLAAQSSRPKQFRDRFEET